MTEKKIFLTAKMDKRDAKEGEAVTACLAVPGVRADKDEKEKANTEDGEDPGIVVVERACEAGGRQDLEPVQGGVETNTTSNTGDRPGRENETVEGTNVIWAPHVSEEGGNGTKTSSVAGGEEPHQTLEGRVVLSGDEVGGQGDDNDLQAEGKKEDSFASSGGVEVMTAVAEDLDDQVGGHGVEETAKAVEDTIKSENVDTFSWGLAKQIDSHGFDAGNSDETKELVAEKYEVEEDIVRGQDGLGESIVGVLLVVEIGGGVILVKVLFLFGIGGNDDVKGGVLFAENVRGEVVGRGAESDGAYEEEKGEAATDQAEGGGETNDGEDVGVKFGPGNVTGTETTDGKAGGNATVVREPFLQCGDGGDVVETETETTENTKAKVDTDDGVRVERDGGYGVTDAKSDGTDQEAHTRSVALDPGAQDGGGKTERADGDKEGGGGIVGFGVAINSGIYGGVKGGKRVERSAAELDNECRKEEDPAVERDAGDIKTEGAFKALLLFALGGRYNSPVLRDYVCHFRSIDDFQVSGGERKFLAGAPRERRD